MDAALADDDGKVVDKGGRADRGAVARLAEGAEPRLGGRALLAAVLEQKLFTRHERTASDDIDTARIEAFHSAVDAGARADGRGGELEHAAALRRKVHRFPSQGSLF